jgi:hypothetical protein
VLFCDWLKKYCASINRVARFLTAGVMGIKSEKTFEEIVERIIAVFRPQKSAEARDYVESDLNQDTNEDTKPPRISAASNNDGGGDDGR